MKTLTRQETFQLLIFGFIVTLIIVFIYFVMGLDSKPSILEEEFYYKDYYNLCDLHCKSLFVDSMVLDTYVIKDYDCGELNFFCVDTNGTLHYTQLPDKLTRKCFFERGG